MTGSIRLYIAAKLIEGEAVEASGAQAHYLANVLRRGPGDAVHLFNGHDGEFLSVSPEAETWLGYLRSDELNFDDVSRVVHEVAQAARAGRPSALSRVRTNDGHWLVISGSRGGAAATKIRAPP